MGRPDDNPFDLQKASHYSSEEILNHWVDIAAQNGGLVHFLQPRSINPMMLLGGKGSGKTHLLRYCSAPVQAARHQGDLARAIRDEGYVGVYVPAEALNTHKFTGKGLSDEAWSAVFNMYFETWLVSTLLADIRPAIRDGFDVQLGDEFENRLKALFDTEVAIGTLSELAEYLATLRRQTDYIVNQSAITRNLDNLEIPFSNGSLLFGIPDLLSDTFKTLQSPTFVYLIDELENFTAEQQRFLNTLIRYRKGKATIKVGARLYGIRTYSTLGSGERIKAGSEYDEVVLDEFLRRHEGEYRKFSVELVLRRLQRANLKQIDSEKALIHAFDALDQTDYWRTATIELMARYDRDKRLRPHLVKFRRQLEEAQLDETTIARIVESIRLDDHPLLEKANAFLFARRWDGKLETAAKTSQKIASEARAFREGGRGAAPGYAQALSHFSSDLLAQLYREARQRLPYAGLDTFIELSEGIPRNLLNILSHIYRRATFAGEQPFAGGLISVGSQTDGVLAGAQSFWDEAQPDENAPEVRDSIEGLALLFRSIRFSDAPSECDICTFSVNLEKLNERSKALLRTAENWSHLIRISRGAKNRNHRAIDAKFQLAPMLAPRWELSHDRRGSIELQADLANALFDPESRDNLVQLVRSRVRDMYAPRIWNRGASQAPLL